MNKRGISLVLYCTLLSITPATSFATETSSPQASPSAAPSSHLLTQAQKDLIAAARAAFGDAKKNARDGFDRAIADAQAVRDQAISAAGTDLSSVRLARKNYRDSYRTILNAYKSDLKFARLNLAKVIASVKGVSKFH